MEVESFQVCKTEENVTNVTHDQIKNLLLQLFYRYDNFLLPVLFSSVLEYLPPPIHFKNSLDWDGKDVTNISDVSPVSGLIFDRTRIQSTPTTTNATNQFCGFIVFDHILPSFGEQAVWKIKITKLDKKFTFGIGLGFGITTGVTSFVTKFVDDFWVKKYFLHQTSYGSFDCELILNSNCKKNYRIINRSSNDHPKFYAEEGDIILFCANLKNKLLTLRKIERDGLIWEFDLGYINNLSTFRPYLLFMSYTEFDVSIQ